MGARIRTKDWRLSPIGPPEKWPQSLKTAIRLLLSTGHPMFIWWGPRLLQFYNDAYRQSIGDERHPSALGQERRQFSDLFEQSPSFMAKLTGPQHRFELANPAYMRLVGERPVLGKTVAEALPEAVEQGYLDLLDEVFHSGKAHAAFSSEYWPLIDGKPQKRVVDFVYQPIKDREGTVTGIFVEGFDVTARA